MAHSSPPASGSRLRARKGQQGKQDEDWSSKDEQAESMGSSTLNIRVVQILIVLQGFCFLGFGHYFKYQQPLDRQLKVDFGVKDINLELSAAPELQASGVYLVNDLSLPMFLAADTNGSLIYFHSNRCRHCKTFTPAYEAAARELMTTRNFPLGMVNLNSAPAAAKRYSVRKVPTVLLLKNNKVISQMPPTSRSSAKIVEFVRNAMQPALVTLHTRAEFDDAMPQMRSLLQPKSNPVIVGFKDAGNTHHDALEFAAEQSRGRAIFLWVTTKLESDPLMKAYFATEEQDISYTGAASPEAVSIWVKGLLGES